MMTIGSWRPLLEGETAEEAWVAIRTVGDHLAAAGPVATVRDHASTGIPDPTLGSGSAGIALFLAFLADAVREEGYDEMATAYLDASVEAVSSWPLPAGLYGGFSGIAWTLRHLGEVEGDEAATEELDGLLLTALGRVGGQTEYDLISGLVGLGVYGAEALPHPFGRRCLERIVERLDELHEDTPDGVTWFTPPERVPESQRQIAPGGYYNLGVAHGVPGILVILAICCRAGVVEGRCSLLLEGAVEWVMAQRQPPQVGSSFASWIVDGMPQRQSRLAWCYGDPGVGAAILTAGLAVGNTEWERTGVEILRGAARRPPGTSEIRDPGLCHGAAGLAHLFNRAYQATGDEVLAHAARHWYGQTLTMRRPGEGVAGFRSWEPTVDGGLELRGVPGLLTGASGVGLALLAGVTPVEPTWDRVLTLSVPAAAQTGDPLEATAGAPVGEATPIVEEAVP